MSAVMVPKPALDPAAQRRDRRARAATAGLSAVGAGAGALGLGVGAKEVLTHGWKGTPKLTRSLIPVELAGLAGEVSATHLLHQDVKRQPVAKGHGMDISSGGQAGKRIREDAKPSKVVRTEEEAYAEAFGKALLGKLVKPAEKLAAGAAKPKSLAQMRDEARGSLSAALESRGTVLHPVGKAKVKTKKKDSRKLASVSDLGVDGTFMGQQAANHLERARIHRERGHQLSMEAVEEESALKRRQANAHLAQANLLEHNAKQKVTGAVGALGLTEGLGSAGLKGAGGGGKGKVDKARGGRRFDPEADRQRRLGVYSGAALGAGILTGEAARRTVQVGSTGRSGTARGGVAMAHHVGFKPGLTKRGAILAGATAGLGALAAGGYKRGISRRNQTWT